MPFKKKWHFYQYGGGCFKTPGPSTAPALVPFCVPYRSGPGLPRPQSVLGPSDNETFHQRGCKYKIENKHLCQKGISPPELYAYQTNSSAFYKNNCFFLKFLFIATSHFAQTTKGASKRLSFFRKTVNFFYFNRGDKITVAQRETFSLVKKKGLLLLVYAYNPSNPSFALFPL